MTDRLPSPPLPIPGTSGGRLLTREAFHRLSDVPPEQEWFNNIDNVQTSRAYKNAVHDFMRFTGIVGAQEFRSVTRAHVIAWRDDLKARRLSGASIRHRLAALSSLFQYLCERNAVTHNPVKGVKRPFVESYEGKTPALGDQHARQLLDGPDLHSLKGKRDRAIVAMLLYHGLRREEEARLTVSDVRQLRRGVPHVRIQGKGGKIRYIPLHPTASSALTDYLNADGRGAAESGPLFRPLHRSRKVDNPDGITPDGIYKLVRTYTTNLGVPIGAHALRATAATNALENGASIEEVQAWLGHANITTTRLYDKRRLRPEESPTFKVRY